MRIAFVSLMGGLPWGGSEALWTKTAHLALKDGHNVLVSVYDWGALHPEIKKLHEKGAKIHRRSRFESEGSIFYKTLLYFKNRISWINDAYMPIIRFNPGHIIVNQGDTFDISIHHYPLYKLIKQNNIPFSLICHNHVQYGDIPQENVYPRAKNIFEQAKNVFFVSKRMQSIAERKLCTKLPNGRFTWNPLNLNETNYIPWPENTITQFAVVGNIMSGKGHDTLLECLAASIWRTRTWHLNLYGKGQGEDYLKDLAAFYQLTDKITFHGHVSDVTEIWCNNHILLIPSAGEGLPISLIEAMICGRPAVVTDVGGNTEVITEDVTGFIAEAPSVSSYSKALEKAWTNKEKWEEMGRNAQSFCIKNLDLNPGISLLNTIIENL